MKAKIVLLCLVSFFVAPFILLFFAIQPSLDFPFQAYFNAFKASFIQASITALVCLLVSLLIVPHLTAWPRQWIDSFLKLSVLPSVFPSLFSLLILFSYFSHFPYGRWGIVFSFIVVYFGLTLSLIYHSYVNEVLPYKKIWQIYNFTFKQKFFLVYMPLLLKPILSTAVLIYLGCFASLSIPLMAGGGKELNLELFTYESVLVDGKWSILIWLSLFQVFYLIGFQYLTLTLRNTKKFTLNLPDLELNKKVSSYLAFSILISYIIFYFGGYLFQVILALKRFPLNNLLTADLGNAFLNSLLLVIIVSLFLALIIFSFAYLQFYNLKYHFLFNIMMPSSTLVAVCAFLIFKSNSRFILEIFKIALGIVVLYGLSLIKLYVQSQFDNIQQQIQIARIYNIRFLDFVTKLLWPQLKKPIKNLFFMVVLISYFEFGFIKILSVENIYFSTYLERLISFYRSDQAFIASFLLLVALFSPFYIIQRFSYRKSDHVSY